MNLSFKLKFMVSPHIMPALDTCARANYKKPWTEMNRHEQDLMMHRARKQFLPEILKKRSASMLSLLDATVMNAFNLSSAVSLFGSTEEQDIKRYNEAYDSFYQTLLEVMERRIDNEMLPNCKADDSEYKILKNWVEKIKWLHGVTT